MHISSMAAVTIVAVTTIIGIVFLESQATGEVQYQEPTMSIVEDTATGCRRFTNNGREQIVCACAAPPGE